jgi:hypothetical protein
MPNRSGAAEQRRAQAAVFVSKLGRPERSEMTRTRLLASVGFPLHHPPMRTLRGDEAVVPG